MVSIRRAVADDAPALHALAAETFPLACPPGTSPEAIAEHIERHLSFERFVEYLADPQREIWVADDAAGRTLAGYTMLVFGEPSDPDVAAALTARPTVELSKCYARAAHHGAGVASALITASVDSATSRGAAGIWLGVNRYNGRANAFYQKNGFVVVGTKTFHVGDEPQEDFTRERVL
ncbi:MAG: GNAT family N-acetyltransferase [Actinomycetota bacterium]